MYVELIVTNIRHCLEGLHFPDPLSHVVYLICVVFVRPDSQAQHAPESCSSKFSLFGTFLTH